MSIESAKKWVDHIHSNQELGKELMQINNWDHYFQVVNREGYSFSKEDLDQAWDQAFGSGELSENELDQVSGGAAGNPSPPTVMGVRG